MAMGVIEGYRGMSRPQNFPSIGILESPLLCGGPWTYISPQVPKYLGLRYQYRLDYGIWDLKPHICVLGPFFAASALGFGAFRA